VGVHTSPQTHAANASKLASTTISHTLVLGCLAAQSGSLQLGKEMNTEGNSPGSLLLTQMLAAGRSSSAREPRRATNAMACDTEHGGSQFSRAFLARHSSGLAKLTSSGMSSQNVWYAPTADSTFLARTGPWFFSTTPRAWPCSTSKDTTAAMVRQRPPRASTTGATSRAMFCGPPTGYAAPSR
jgi:hypothetical protein